MGRGGGNRRGGKKPDQGSGGRGRNRSCSIEFAEDECRKETADRVARHQGDY